MLLAKTLRRRSKIFSLLYGAMLCAVALFLSVLAAEFFFRNVSVPGKIKVPHIFLRGSNTSKIFTIDPLFGFRPVLNNDFYNQYGTKLNSYTSQKRSGVRRVLFIGDSVTARGRILKPLEELYGKEKFEYWNAGVESFNTVQELEFYKKYNFAIHPDICVLFFHNNDFGVTPAAFWSKPDELMIYTPRSSIAVPSRWLFEKSHLFRFLTFRFLEMKNQPGGHERVQAVREALEEFQSILEGSGIDFVVAVLPLAEDPEKWRPGQMRSRDDILKILEDLEIRHIDLFPVLTAMRSDYEDCQESPGDNLHPSDAFAKKMAEYLYGEHLLVAPAAQDAAQAVPSGP